MKIAVIGAGISGLGAAWILSQEHDVHVFESENRLGGHAHTVDIKTPSSQSIGVDTGFLVYNELTYPHLTAFFKALGVETVKSDMSLSIQVENKNLEWNGATLNSVFGQRKNFFKFSFYFMLWDILRFDREAEKNLALARRHAWTLAELMQKRRYSQSFIQDYLLPMGAAIWSTPEKEMLTFPAATFLTFFINHHLLQVNNRPEWRTVKNGSRNYVERVKKKLKNIHLGTPVLEVKRHAGTVTVVTANGEATFDRVVFATHPPITLKILKDASPKELNILKCFPYEENHTVLHKDKSFMPKTAVCWAAWNVRASQPQDASQKISLTYYINQLQPLNTPENIFVTLNAPREVRDQERSFVYHHPQFTQNAIRAQRELKDIQGTGGVYYCGAWSRYGFHEDGLLSAVNVGELFNIQPPWMAQ